MAGVIVTLCIFGLAALISYIVVSGWEERKANAEAEAERDFEFLKGIQKKYGFSNYNLWRLCQVYYEDEIIPESKRHNSEEVYKLFSFYLAEKFLESSKNENLIEVETGLDYEKLDLDKASVVEYILNREGLHSVAKEEKDFNTYADRPRKIQTTWGKLRYKFDDESIKRNAIYCDEHIMNPKCLLLQMEQSK